jgi:lipid-A-disaccharide synthase
MKIFLAAGEVSGDYLGAVLTKKLKKFYPQATIEGITGPKMEAAGCNKVYSIDFLSVMGIAEVIRSLPRILKFRRALLNFLKKKSS